jgi:hypothetical protein
VATRLSTSIRLPSITRFIWQPPIIRTSVLIIPRQQNRVKSSANVRPPVHHRPPPDENRRLSPRAHASARRNSSRPPPPHRSLPRTRTGRTLGKAPVHQALARNSHTHLAAFPATPSTGSQTPKNSRSLPPITTKS